MKIRMYVDLIDGITYASATHYSHAASNPVPVTTGYRRYFFDLDFPPGTFAEERSTQLPSPTAKEM